MEKVKLYTGTQHNQSINLWGEVVTFDSEGVAEVSEKTATKAAIGIPGDYSLEATKKRTPEVSSYSFQKSGDGVGKRAASVVEKEHTAKVEKQKKDAKRAEDDDAEEAKAEKATKKTKKKSSKKTEDAKTDTPPNDENPKDSDSGEGKSGDIWK